MTHQPTVQKRRRRRRNERWLHARLEVRIAILEQWLATMPHLRRKSTCPASLTTQLDSPIVTYTIAFPDFGAPLS